jgi:hypothetical protein
VALFVVGLVILFFTAPWYTVLGGIALLATAFLHSAFNPDAPAPSFELVRNVLWSFQLVGFLWVVVKRCRKSRVYGDSGKQKKRTDRERVHTSREAAAEGLIGQAANGTRGLSLHRNLLL